MSAKDRLGPSHDNTCCAFVANSGMVFPSSELADNAATAVQSRERRADQSSGGNSTPNEFETGLNGMQVIWRRLSDCQISANIADIIVKSWRPGMQKQYSVYINRWTRFCNEREINPIVPSLTSVLDFLHTLYAQDLSYSTINTARSALNCYLMDAHLHSTNHTVSTHPFVTRYMKGVFNSRTPTPKYSDTWCSIVN